MSKPTPPRYRTTNWRSYNSAQKRRGSLLVWHYKDMVWLAPQAGHIGRPPVLSDAAIQFCLMVKVPFGLPLRQTTGMVSSILQMVGLRQAKAKPIFDELELWLHGKRPVLARFQAFSACQFQGMSSSMRLIL
jgi:hypothetical protein